MRQRRRRVYHRDPFRARAVRFSIRCNQRCHSTAPLGAVLLPSLPLSMTPCTAAGLTIAAVLLLALPQLVASNDHDALASALRADFEARGKEQCGHLPWWRPASTSRTTTSTSISSYGGGQLDPKGTGERDGDGRARVIYQLPPTGFGDQLAGLTTAAAAAVLTNRSLSLSVPPTWGLVFEFNAAATATATASSSGSDAVVQAEVGAQVEAAAAAADVVAEVEVEVELDCQDSPTRRRGKNRGKRGGASPSSTGSEPTVPLCSPPLQVAKQEEVPLVSSARSLLPAPSCYVRGQPHHSSLTHHFSSPPHTHYAHHTCTLLRCRSHARQPLSCVLLVAAFVNGSNSGMARTQVWNVDTFMPLHTCTPSHTLTRCLSLPLLASPCLSLPLFCGCLELTSCFYRWLELSAIDDQVRRALVQSGLAGLTGGPRSSVDLSVDSSVDLSVDSFVLAGCLLRSVVAPKQEVRGKVQGVTRVGITSVTLL